MTRPFRAHLARAARNVTIAWCSLAIPACVVYMVPPWGQWTR